jgi:hypothetical protein
VPELNGPVLLQRVHIELACANIVSQRASESFQFGLVHFKQGWPFMLQVVRKEPGGTGCSTSQAIASSSSLDHACKQWAAGETLPSKPKTLQLSFARQGHTPHTLL